MAAGGGGGGLTSLGAEEKVSSDAPSPSKGRARKLAMLIENNVIRPFETVYYRNKRTGGRMAEGRITADGIVCNCCNQIFNLSKFEAHAGSTNHRPASNIFLEDGRSLSECQLQLKGDPDSTELGKEKEDEDVVMKEVEEEERRDRSLEMLGAIIACSRRNRDPDVGRFLEIFVRQSIFVVTFFFIVRLLTNL